MNCSTAILLLFHLKILFCTFTTSRVIPITKLFLSRWTNTLYYRSLVICTSLSVFEKQALPPVKYYLFCRESHFIFILQSTEIWWALLSFKKKHLKGLGQLMLRTSVTMHVSGINRAGAQFLLSYNIPSARRWLVLGLKWLGQGWSRSLAKKTWLKVTLFPSPPHMLGPFCWKLLTTHVPSPVIRDI